MKKNLHLIGIDLLCPFSGKTGPKHSRNNLPRQRRENKANNKKETKDSNISNQRKERSNLLLKEILLWKFCKNAKLIKIPQRKSKGRILSKVNQKFRKKIKINKEKKLLNRNSVRKCKNHNSVPKEQTKFT